MSTWILHEKTISKIANLIDVAYNHGFNRLGFHLSEDAKTAIGTVVAKAKNSEEHDKIIYRDLYLTNIRSFAEAYPRKIKTKEQAVYMPEHSWEMRWKIRNGEIIDDVQAFKSIQCFIYNAQCHATENKPIFVALKSIERQLGNKIIESLPAFAAATWG